MIAAKGERMVRAKIPENAIGPEDAAKTLRVSVRRIQQLLRAGRIEGAVFFLGRWFIPADFRVRMGSRGPDPAWPPSRMTFEE